MRASICHMEGTFLSNSPIICLISSHVFIAKPLHANLQQGPRQPLSRQNPPILHRTQSHLWSGVGIEDSTRPTQLIRPHARIRRLPSRPDSIDHPMMQEERRIRWTGKEVLQPKPDREMASSMDTQVDIRARHRVLISKLALLWLRTRCASEPGSCLRNHPFICLTALGTAPKLPAAMKDRNLVIEISSPGSFRCSWYS